MNGHRLVEKNISLKELGVAERTKVVCRFLF